MILLNPMQCCHHSYTNSASLSHRVRASYANCPRPSVSRNSESKHVSFSSFLPPHSSKSEEKASDNSGRASPGPEPSPRPHKQIQTQMEEEEKGEGVCCYGKRHGRMHPNHFPMSKGDDPNNTLFPVPFALRPLMDGYNFPNNLDCFVPFFTRQQRVREGKKERGAQQFGPPLSSPPLA